MNKQIWMTVLSIGVFFTCHAEEPQNDSQENNCNYYDYYYYYNGCCPYNYYYEESREWDVFWPGRREDQFFDSLTY
jgi:hypothetical protein